MATRVLGARTDARAGGLSGFTELRAYIDDASPGSKVGEALDDLDTFDVLEDVDPAVARLERPVAPKKQCLRRPLDRHLFGAQVAFFDWPRVDCGQRSEQLLAICLRRARNDVDVLRRTRVPMGDDGEAADDHEIDVVPEQDAKQFVSVELCLRAATL
jgi:hypothetical protein